MLNENSLVEKSKQFIWAKYTGWSARELAVFDTYLSRINARNPESAEVIFTKREYEELMGLKEVRPEQLNRYVKNFIQNAVSLKTEKGWKNRPLFSGADFEKNENGEWEVRLRCHPDLEAAFFALADSGYQRYYLKYTLSLKSKYSKLLYCLLKDNLFRKEWQVELKELRELLGATSKTYESFKDFNKFVLQKAEEEINANTDIVFAYEKITKGRLTRAVKFKIKKRAAEQAQIDGQMDIYDFPEYCPDKEELEQNEVMDGKYALWSEACSGEFTKVQIEELSLLAGNHVEYDSADPGRYDLNVYRYLLLKYKSLQNKQGVKSRFGYMKYLVENDV
jgi:hypothetical protein